MNQIAEAMRPPAPGRESGTSRFTGNLACSPFGQSYHSSLFQDTVGSNPFPDSHAVSKTTDINVNDLEQVEMSSIHDEATNGRL